MPAEYAGQKLTVKCYPHELLVYHDNRRLAQHARCYDRHQDFEQPDHVRELLTYRRKAREQKLLAQFLALSPQAEHYYQALAQKRLNVTHHVQKIVALSEIYGRDAVARAIEDGLTFHAYSCEYIANLLEQQKTPPPSNGALHLTSRQDLLDLAIPEPGLHLYDT